MRKFFLFVLPAVLCSAVTHANSALWSPAVPAVSFDSTNNSLQLSVITPEKVCEAAPLQLKPNFSDPANTYTWITPTGKKVNGVELIITKVSKADAGTYTLKVSSAHGEEQSITTTVKVQAAPSVQLTPLGSACEGSVYSLTAKGASSYQYKWTTPTGSVLNEANIKIEKLQASDAGVYTLHTEDKGCISDQLFELAVKKSPSVSFEGNTTVCENNKLELKAVDSNASYTWWKGQNAMKNGRSFVMEKATNNIAGKYLLQAKANGCVNSAYFTIEVKPSFTAGIQTVASELCEGEELKLNAINSGEGAKYVWKGPAFASENIENKIASVSNTNSGAYSLTVYKNGCSISSSVNIKVNAKPAVKISGANTVCENSELKLSAGAEGNYTWVLPNGNRVSNSTLHINNVTGNNAGNYKLISNAGICSDSSEVAIKVIAVAKPVITGEADVCEGAKLNLKASGNAGTITWLLPNDEKYTGRELQIPSKTNYAGLIKVISENVGCSATESFKLNVKATPAITISGPTEVCRFAPSISLQAKDANGQKGIGVFTGDIISGAGEVSTTKEGVFPVMYSFVAKNGCNVSKTTSINIRKGIEVNAGADLIRKGDEPVQISAIASENYTKIEWTNIPSTEANTLRPTVKPDVTTTYKVTVTNAAGCSASDEVTVKVLKINLANAFSPNGDGINDVYSFEGLRDYPNAQIKIFNSVGKQVFSAKGYSTSWDGKVNGVPAESGTYFYNINLNDGKQNAPLQGWIQLKR